MMNDQQVGSIDDARIPTAYLQDLRHAHPLPQREYEGLLEILHAHPEDRATRDKLAESFLRMVVTVAVRYREHMPLADSIQAGNMGLLKAISKYRADRGPFPAYAKIWIRQAIVRSLSFESRNVRLPEERFRTLSHARKAAAGLWQRLHREPTLADLSQKTGIPIHKILEAERADAIEPGVLEDLDATDPDIDAVFPTALAYHQNIEELLDTGRLLAALHEAIQTIPDPLVHEVIVRVFGIGCDPQPLRQIGEALHCSRTWAARLRDQGLEWIRENLPPDSLEIYRTTNLSP
jgi:RNA polymerase primary sigma factor